MQPPDPLDEGISPPFEPAERDGCLFGRGASDDKGSSVIAIAAVAAYLQQTGACPVNVKLFLEGEEEVGSPSLPAIVARYGGLLRADAMLSADGGRASPTLATINVGARGNTGFEVKLTAAAKDLHSGKYGGAVRNALHEMARLVATLHDRDGRIAVAGYLDAVAPPSNQQRHDTAAFPVHEEEFCAEVGAVPLGEPGYTLRERLTLRPAIDVNGMWGGYTGVGAKTVIPREARAKLTMRLVAGPVSVVTAGTGEARRGYGWISKCAAPARPPPACRPATRWCGPAVPYWSGCWARSRCRCAWPRPCRSPRCSKRCWASRR